MWAKRNGFTIIELLIVVVVIAVLASVTVVAFQGVTRKAGNTVRIANATKILKLIAAYKIGNTMSSLNTAVGNPDEYRCVGDGFTDLNPAQNNSHACVISISSTGTTYLTYIDADPIDNLLKTNGDYKISEPTLTYTSGTYTYKSSGPVLFLRSGPGFLVDGVQGLFGLKYWLDGTNENCGIGGQLRFVNNTGVENWTVAAGAINSQTYSGVTECFVYINPNAT